MRTIRKAFCAGVAFAALSVVADTLYVDRNAKPGGDGKSLETAYNTIAAALNAAEAGWTVKVAPGVYDSEEVVDSHGYTNRVLITKRVHLKSIGGKDVTHIVGKWAKESVSDQYPGIGSDAIRCIRMESTAYYSVVEGFTIRDGACHTLDDNLSGYGGGVVGGNTSFFVADCVVSNCTANRGGALRNITAVRTWITRNRGGSCAGRTVNLVNCLVTGNLDTSPFMNAFLLNCTIAGNASLFSGDKNGYTMYNSIIANNDGIAGSTTPIFADGCVFNSSVSSGCLSNQGSSLGNSKIRTDGSDYHFMAPLMNDWRLLPSSQALGIGNPQHISNSIGGKLLNVEEKNIDVDYFKDFNGNPIPKTGTINAGCIQETAPEPASGAVYFEGATSARCGGLNLYAFSETYPAQFNIKPILAANERPISVTCGNTAYDRFPKMDDSIWVMAPPAGSVTTNKFETTTNIIYVSPSGNNANSGLDPLLPKKTLQAAVNAADKSAVIVASEGVYDEDGEVRNGVSNRVYISYVAKRYLRLVGAGRGKSIIKGAADMTGPAGDGRGPNACRCVCIDGSGSAVQGFTLRDGFSGYAEGTEDPSTGDTRGGAFTADVSGNKKNARVYLLDCDITSCGATRGGAAYCGTLVRCRISDCYSAGGGIRYARLYSCLIDDNTSLGTAALYGGGNTAYHCTFHVAPSDVTLGSYSLNGLTNCIAKLSAGTFGMSASEIGVNLIDGEPIYSTTTPVVEGKGGIVGDSLLMNPAEKDFRPISCSSAVGLGEVFDNYEAHYTSDVNGEPLLFSDGRPICGAYQTTVQAVIVPKAKYGTFTLPAAITNGVDDGATLTVRLENANRPCIGFVVNGVTNVSDDLTYTFSGGASGRIAGAVVIEPAYTTHWYVDANYGDDANSGFTPRTARRTLKGIMDWGGRIYGGDTIHAAEGLYNEGEMEYEGGETKARVVIPINVTLVADGAKEATIIEGGCAKSDGDVLGNGQGAVRCVAMSDYRSVVKGFTIRGGHTLSGVSTDADYVGGGVYTKATTGSICARVIDCTITNCCANRGGGGYNRIDYVNCMFVDNRAATASSAMAGGSAFNCVFTRNRGATCVQASRNIVNCTFFDNYENSSDLQDSTVAFDITIPGNGAAIYNTVAKGPCKGNSSYHFHASNCVFNATYDKSEYKNKNFYDDNTRVVDESCLEFSPDGRLLSMDTNVVDRADMELLAGFTRMDYEKDALGGQRIYNGKLDIGAVEFDWRPLYANTLGGGFAQVPYASPDVVRSDDGDCVIIGSGALQLDMGGNPDGRNMRYAIPVEVLGDGTLSVILNGDVIASCTAADGSRLLEFRNTFARNTLEFSYDGNDDGARISSMVRDAPNFVITFR